jgi:hypothetical protein
MQRKMPSTSSSPLSAPRPGFTARDVKGGNSTRFDSVVPLLDLFRLDHRPSFPPESPIPARLLSLSSFARGLLFASSLVFVVAFFRERGKICHARSNNVYDVSAHH